ncbi:DinB family protein [Rhodococcus olei]|uniref:DinB family protein n=1 Tax=Rhodococcus olei TaxID=2161675 RepID=A0ABP8P2L0_9NOCA
MTVTLIDERTDLASTLATHRGFLRHTAQGLTDEQATTRSTVSELTIAGLVKHLIHGERNWTRFIVEGTSAMRFDEEAIAQHLEHFRMREGETLDGLLAEYETVANETDELLRSLPSLDVAHPLPEAPWFEGSVSWSARRVFLHLIAETAQHAGHADIIREALDGQKTMG